MTTLHKSSLLVTCLAVALMLFIPGASAEERVGDPYTLDSCPISGKKLGSMGDPIGLIIEGREVKICCAGCEKPVKADPAAIFAKIDEKVIAQQQEYYPLETCAISGSKLGSMGDPIDIVVNNRHVRLCCDGCVDKAKADPVALIAKLDKPVIAKQSKTYNVNQCVISGETLSDTATNLVVGNRLIKVCCAGCIDKVYANPAKMLAMIDSGKVEAEGSDHK
ncbi:MAG: hypothetical protein VCD00_12025 [Candidatus Hydrogenedentota bacterium]